MEGRILQSADIVAVIFILCVLAGFVVTWLFVGLLFAGIGHLVYLWREGFHSPVYEH